MSSALAGNNEFIAMPTFDGAYNFHFNNDGLNGTARMFTPAQFRTLTNITRVSSTLSVATALIVILTFIFWKRFRTPSNRLVFFMSIADLLSAIAMLIGNLAASQGAYSPLCIAQAFMIQWGDLSSISWTASMSFNLLLVLFMTRSQRDLASLEKFYFFVSYGVTFCLAFIPIFAYSSTKGLVYGEDVLFCWIRSSWPELRMALFYGPVWCIFVFNLTIYTISGIKIVVRTMNLPQKKAPPPKACLRSSSLANAITEDRRGTNFSGISISSTFSSSSVISAPNPVPVSGFRRRYFTRIALFLFAYIIVWIMPSINRVTGWILGAEYEQSQYAAYIAQQLLTPLRGFVDFCCYFLPSWWIVYKEQQREQRIMMMQSVSPLSPGI